VFNIKNKKTKLQIWDTAGQESFKSITRAYYKGSIGVLLIFDLTEASSFRNVKHWLKELRMYSHEKIRLTLIGNKADLSS
jgi:Ras-related protein Rab-2A